MAEGQLRWNKTRIVCIVDDDDLIELLSKNSSDEEL